MSEEIPNPTDVHVVINCGHPEGPQETHIPYGELALTMERHELENRAARERHQADLERAAAERQEAARVAAETAARTAANQAAALSELKARARTSPDLALMARLLGIQI